MKANFDLAFNITMGIEGGYANDQADTGGETYRGISRKNFPSWHGWTLIDEYKKNSGFVQLLAKDSALQQFLRDFYKANFWDVLNLDNCINQSIANEMFDTAVNMGTGIAASFLQISLDATDGKTEEFADIAIDRQIGPATMEALNGHPRPGEVLKLINCLQGSRYVDIVKANPKQKRFMRSWLSRVELNIMS
jgi:lysozyme family protein